MYRIVFVITIMFCWINPLSYAEDVSLDELIRGVNQARLNIKSGEVTCRITEHIANSKTEEEIDAWIKVEKEKWLSKFKPDPFNPNIDIEQYERGFLIPFLNFRANDFRKHDKIEYSTTIFQILKQEITDRPTEFQYKLTMVDTPGMPIEKMSERFRPSDTLHLLAYDMETQVKENLGNILYTSESTILYDFNKHGGLRNFWFYGRSPYGVPQDAELLGKETIDGVQCYVLSFRIPNKKRKMQIWVDPVKDFSLHKFELLFDTPKKQIIWGQESKKFRKFGDLWFPQIVISSNYRQTNVMANLFTYEIIDADFNVVFPDDFFQINRDYYKPPEIGQLPDAEPIPETPTTDKNKLLLCGPNSLLHLCRMLNVTSNLDELKKLSDFDPQNGTTMEGLKTAATYKGLAAKTIVSSPELLKGDMVPLPAIAHINTNHFVVFESVDNDGVDISDSVQEDNTHLTWDELTEIWNGEILVFDIKKSAKQQPMPLAFSDTPVYNFGKILAGKKVKHTFNIKNVGQKPLNILEITDT